MDQKLDPKFKSKIEIDLKKAKPSCKKCHGTGKAGYRSQGRNEEGQEILVPIVCFCVYKRGGVTRTPLKKDGTTGTQGPTGEKTTENATDEKDTTGPSDPDKGIVD